VVLPARLGTGRALLPRRPPDPSSGVNVYSCMSMTQRLSREQVHGRAASSPGGRFHPAFHPPRSEATKPAYESGLQQYRHGDSNPGFRRERAAS
jgi:hypothetical protein